MPKPSCKNGFTLLETILALGVGLLIIPLTVSFILPVYNLHTSIFNSCNFTNQSLEIAEKTMQLISKGERITTASFPLESNLTIKQLNNDLFILSLNKTTNKGESFQYQQLFKNFL